MTLRSDFEAQLKKDIERNKKIILTDKNGTKFTFDEKRQIMVGKDQTGREWIKQIDSDIPAYWHYCPNQIGVTELGHPKICNSPSVIFIIDHGKDSICTACNHVSKIDIRPPPGTKGFEILEKLKKEG